jgi:hypothetical protein
MSEPTSHNPLDYEPSSIEQHARIETLKLRWAKAAILFGLGCMWAGTHSELRYTLGFARDVWMLISLCLFVMGGYLALAGSRTHLYLSSHHVADYVCRRIDEATGK